jgi:hypothetical protein
VPNYFFDKLRKLLGLDAKGKPSQPLPPPAELAKMVPAGVRSKVRGSGAGKVIGWYDKGQKPGKLAPSGTEGPADAFTGRAGLGGEQLDQEDEDLFVRGELALFLDSSWLSYAKYYPLENELEVGILKPVNCTGLVASQVNEELARSFAAAPSKGSWWWHYVFVAGEGAGRGMNRKTHRPCKWL